MRILNLFFAGFFFLIGVSVAVVVLAVVISFAALSFFADTNTALQVVTWAMIIALILPVFFLGMLSFYSLEYAAHLYDNFYKSTKLMPVR